MKVKRLAAAPIWVPWSTAARVLLATGVQSGTYPTAWLHELEEYPVGPT